jgi:hypothetical protein
MTMKHPKGTQANASHVVHTKLPENRKQATHCSKHRPHKITCRSTAMNVSSDYSNVQWAYASKACSTEGKREQRTPCSGISSNCRFVNRWMTDLTACPGIHNTDNNKTFPYASMQAYLHATHKHSYTPTLTSRVLSSSKDFLTFVLSIHLSHSPSSGNSC